MGELEPNPDLRIGDKERHQVAEILRTAAGEGRLDLTELDERLEATFKAKTYADLVPLTVDLPVAQTEAFRQARRVAPTGEVTSERHLAIMGGYSGPKGGEEVRSDSPVLRVKGFAIMGGVSVSRRQPPGTPKRLRGH